MEMPTAKFPLIFISPLEQLPYYAESMGLEFVVIDFLIDCAVKYGL
jgi:hypothetical protein